MLFTAKIQKILLRYLKSSGITARGTTATAKQKLTTTTKNNDRGTNDHNNTRTNLQKGRYNHYFKVPARNHSSSKERYSELKTI